MILRKNKDKIKAILPMNISSMAVKTERRKIILGEVPWAVCEADRVSQAGEDMADMAAGEDMVFQVFWAEAV